MSENSEQKPKPSYFSQDAYTPATKAPPAQPSSDAMAGRPTFSQQTYKPARPAGGNSSTTVQAPFIVPLAMLIVCFVLAFVDLAFLNDVIGQVLNVEQTMSLVVSAALGLIGLAFMMHLGYEQVVHPNLGFMTKFMDYSIWLLLGVAIAATRFFAAVILDLQATDEVALVNVFGTGVRQVDMLFAPIMFLLYIITGLGAKRALEGLLLNRDFDKWRLESKDQRTRRKQEEEEAKRDIATTRKEREHEMEAKKREAAAQKEADRKAKHDAKQQQRAATQPISQANAVDQLKLKEARKRHGEAVKAYTQLDAKFRKSVQRATDLLAKLEGIEAEATALVQRRDNMLDVITKSEMSVQQQVAMLLHAKTQESIAELEAVIAAHNAKSLDRL